MQPTELELYPTTQLVEELLRRQTFLGVVVHAEDQFKGDPWTGEKIFKVRFNGNLNSEEACRLLDTVAGHMNRQDF